MLWPQKWISRALKTAGQSDAKINSQTTASSLTHATPSITTSLANAMLVTAHGFASSSSWTPPSGMTEGYDRANGAVSATGMTVEGSYVLQAVAGASGAKSATAAANADVGNTHILALRPAGVSLSLTKPTGVVTNDVLIAAVAFNNSSAAITPPAGWTLVRRTNNTNTTSNALAVYSKAAGGSEPASYAWTIAGGTFLVGGIQAFSGADTTTPINVENGQTTASSLTHAAPSITTTVANAMLVTAHAYASSGSWTPPSGMTEGYDRANGAANAAGMTVEGSYVLQAVAGATGAKSATAAANADVGVTHLLALRRPNVAPTVSVTSPTNGASFTAPASITLTATAADSDGTITKVEFFQGGTNLIATVTTSPYTFNWTGVTAGSYAITAKATDNLTAVTTSSAVNVTVNAAQALYFIHPDQLNTPRVITDATPQGVWRWDNDDAFGGNIPNSNPSSLGNFTFNPRFPGQYFDSETNNHYNYYRDYSPDIGRYIESDPVGLRGGINTYGYVDSSPLSDSDPEGERNSNQMSPVPILPNSALNRMPGQPGYVPPGAEAEFMACFETCLISRQGACLVGNATGALLGMSVAAVGSAWSFGADYPLIAPLTTAIGSQFGAAVCRTYYFSNSCYQKCSAQQKQNMCPAS